MSGRSVAGDKGTRRPIVVDDLYRVTYVADPQLSPDGQTVAFVRTTVDRENDNYRSQIWLVPADGGAPPRRFTAGPNDTAPRWSPGGRRLAFLSRRGAADAKAQLWLIAVDVGEAWPLTDLPEGVADPQWSPTGDRIACTGQVRARDDRDRPAAPPPFEPAHGKPSDVLVIDRLRYKLDGEGFFDDRRWHLFVVPVAGQERGVARQVTFGDSNETAPAWSPGGTHLAFISARHLDRDHDNRSDLWVLAVDDEQATATCLTQTAGPCAGPVWSPDGQSITYTGHDNAPDYGPTTLDGVWVVPADGSAPPRHLTTGQDLSIGSGVGTDLRYGTPEPRLCWTSDSAAILCLANDRGAVPALRIAVASGTTTSVLGGPRQITNLALSKDGRCLAFAASTATMPADLFACDLSADGAASNERRLTDVNAALGAEVEFRAAEKQCYLARDGQQIDAWVITPPGFDPARRYPAIVEIHGGPHMLYGEACYLEFQLLAARGYVVFYTNPRGSEGYGQEFVSCLRNDWGGVDYRDVMDGIDWLVQQGYVDPDRLGVTGGSYGGYLTNWIVTQTDRFRAAVSGRSTSNRASHYGASDIGHLTGDWEFGGPPWERQEQYRDRSPLTFVANVRTPLLLESQEQDHRCPISQAEEFYTALKRLRQSEVQLLRFPNESHGMSRGGKPAHRAERLERLLHWFDRFLADPLDSAVRT